MSLRPCTWPSRQRSSGDLPQAEVYKSQISISGIITNRPLLCNPLAGECPHTQCALLPGHLLSWCSAFQMSFSSFKLYVKQALSKYSSILLILPYILCCRQHKFIQFIFCIIFYIRTITQFISSIINGHLGCICFLLWSWGIYQHLCTFLLYFCCMYNE